MKEIDVDLGGEELRLDITGCILIGLSVRVYQSEPYWLVWAPWDFKVP